MTHQRVKAKDIATDMQNKPGLLTIPLELRQEIYSHLTYPSSAILRDLLLTNRRLSKEVKPFLYKRPPRFDGQYQLFEWLEKVDQDYLSYVIDISIKIIDIDPEMIVGALGKRLREARANREPFPSGQGNPYYEACYQDLKRIQQAFSLLPAVRSLTVLEAAQADPQPPMPMLENFAKMLGQCFPNLLYLISTQPLFPVHFIANKPRLRGLQFSANSPSSEDEIAKVCRALVPNLHLGIHRYDSEGKSHQYQWSCTTEFLSNLPPLGALSLVEDLPEQPSDLLEEVFIDSIDSMKRHVRSMRKLRVMADPPEDAKKAGLMKRNLLRFLEFSNLREVEVLGTYASVYRHLPGSVEKFILRMDRWCCDPDGSLSDIFDELMQHVKFRAMNKDPQVPKLTNLKAIELHIHSHQELMDPDDEDDVDARTLELRAKAQLARIGIHFRLVIRGNAEECYD